MAVRVYHAEAGYVYHAEAGRVYHAENRCDNSLL
jgi:hypothetical protein